MKVIIIGGVATGATCAARLRRLDEFAEITIYEKSGYISYANCGLPYYIGKVIEERDDLTLQSPESFKSRYNIDVKVNHEVISIDSENKKVEVLDSRTGNKFYDSYDKLVLSPGAKALSPFVMDDEYKNIFTIKNVEDTFKIDDFIIINQPKEALIIGGGFIGIEMAENLVERGLNVTLAEASSQVLSILDSDMVSFAQNTLRKNKIKLVLNSKIKGFRKDNNATITILENGEEIKSDLVILSLGVYPETTLAKDDAALELGVKDSIKVNEYLQTSDNDIYAGGDAVEVTNFITNEKTLVPLAGIANRMGRIIANNIINNSEKMDKVLGTSILKLFDKTIATVGITERKAIELGLDYDKVVLSPLSHASYYPGAKIMVMKVIFEKTTDRILGAQIIGNDGVDKRIDVIAASIKAGLKASDMANLELSYAPPFSSAKDPVNIAANMIEDIQKGLVKQFHIDEIEKIKKRKDSYLIDVRSEKEFESARIDGFANIPLDILRDKINSIPRDKKLYVMCLSAMRSYIATRILTNFGFEAYNLSGGYRFYSEIEKDKGAK